MPKLNAMNDQSGAGVPAQKNEITHVMTALARFLNTFSEQELQKYNGFSPEQKQKYENDLTNRFLAQLKKDPNEQIKREYKSFTESITNPKTSNPIIMGFRKRADDVKNQRNIQAWLAETSPTPTSRLTGLEKSAPVATNRRPQPATKPRRPGQTPTLRR